MSNDDGSNLGLVVKTVLMTAGAIFLFSHLIWFLHWATFFIYASLFAGVVGGGAYLAFKLSRSERENRKLRDDRETLLVGYEREDELADFERRLLSGARR